MGGDIIFGLIAGAVGTTVLNIITYLDMVTRGRAASDVPAKVAGTMLRINGATPQAQHRRSGLGALFGYIVGPGIGLIYGVVRAQFALPAWGTLLAGVVVGLVAMAASDIPAIATRATDARTWGVAGLLSDLIPHLAYGLATAYTFDALRGLL
jgi:hypothetical protein